MNSKLRNSIIVLALLAALVGTTARQAATAAQADPPAIYLHGATFSPGRGEAPSLPPGLAIAAYAQNQRGYYLVQFRGPVEQAWKDELAGIGADILDYVPDFAFKVRMNPAQARRAEQLGSVQWVGIFQPAYKVSPDLQTDAANPRLYKVLVERGSNAGLTRAAITVSGAEVVLNDGEALLVLANASQVVAIANVLDVAWIENHLFQEPHNEFGAGGIMGAGIANASGYDGSTQIVAVADTGLGGGTAATAHADIPSSRISGIFNWPGASSPLCYTVTNDGAIDVDSGHGTHVAGSVLSDGTGGIGVGTAPAARLIFQAVENWAQMQGQCAATNPSGYYLIGIPTDVRQLFQQAYTAGARIHSNSWGSAAAGAYTADSVNTDNFVWNNPDMLITFSAGNEGIDANGNGVIDNDSIGSPATAKNVLTVGASENDRNGNWQCDSALAYTTCAAQGGQNDVFTYGSAWPADYPAAPIGNDPSAGNAQQTAAFSSRGPTNDGRIKPDVVAPGTWILSGYSDLYQQAYDGSANPKNNAFQYDGWGFPYSSLYKYMGGTSMSNPLTAGAAAVVRDYYQKVHGHNASAALVKARLINTAVDLLDENNDGANDNDFPIPNVHEGWGLVNLGAAASAHTFVDAASGLATNGTASQVVNTAGGGLLKISLVWSDYQSTTSAAKNLVNDLDLTVTAPDGAIYRGNVFSGGWSAAGGASDRTNNVENVYIQSAAAGAWTVQVRGFNVPQSTQRYALVIQNGAPGGTPPTATNTPVVPTATNTAKPTATRTPAPVTATNTSVPPTATNTPLPPTATNTSVGPTATHTPAAQAAHVGSLAGSKASVNNKFWRATVTITVHNGSHAAVSGVTVSGNWSGGITGAASCVTNGAGQCSITSANVRKDRPSVTYTVSNLTASGYTYQSGLNHATAITSTFP